MFLSTSYVNSQGKQGFFFGTERFGLSIFVSFMFSLLLTGTEKLCKRKLGLVTVGGDSC